MASQLVVWAGLFLSCAVSMVSTAPAETVMKDLKKFCEAGDEVDQDLAQFAHDCQMAQKHNSELKTKIKALEKQQNNLVFNNEALEQIQDTCLKTDDMKEVLDIVRDLKKKIERMEGEQNLARYKPTEQSSTAYNGFSDRAVDGITHGHYYTGRSCTHTEGNQQDPWWYVDLQTPYPIGLVRIYNRQECCSERINPFIVLVGEGRHAAPLSSSRQCGGEWGSDFTDKGVFSIDCGGIWGRYVGVSLPGAQRTLTLCEVQVFAAKNPEKIKTG
ncbi:fucolectin-6-like [Branchiostoma floridae]|uniref:Fucolectin-6-like n=2 Tax=Branchiostoma floridae TaxID=7739 RepID=A0A9J7M809_BRAFL|nr:fucolectin-6-like [Branchiostoma floridae]